MPSSNGKSLELFFTNGNPHGILTAEVFNWTGKVLSSPRTQLAEVLKRSETAKTGIYILTGEKDDEPCAYIGESENLSKRLKDHDTKKDWWDRVIFITSNNESLNKAHVKYLEAKLIEQAQKTGIVTLDNTVNPTTPSLNESSISNMEEFLEHIHMILPAIRIDLFIERTRKSDQVGQESINNPIFILSTLGGSISAKAELNGSDFIIKKGSQARKEWIGDTSKYLSYSPLFTELVEKGILIEEGDHRVFSTDYAFSSTSAAGAIINGRSTAGPISWLLEKTGETYKTWEANQLNDIS